MVDFHKFFDGENITQEDLVAWVNVGMHHLVSSSVLPVLQIVTFPVSIAASRRRSEHTHERGHLEVCDTSTHYELI